MTFCYWNNYERFCTALPWFYDAIFIYGLGVFVTFGVIFSLRELGWMRDYDADVYVPLCIFWPITVAITVINVGRNLLKATDK